MIASSRSGGQIAALGLVGTPLCGCWSDDPPAGSGFFVDPHNHRIDGWFQIQVADPPRLRLEVRVRGDFSQTFDPVQSKFFTTQDSAHFADAPAIGRVCLKRIRQRLVRPDVPKRRRRVLVFRPLTRELYQLTPDVDGGHRRPTAPRAVLQRLEPRTRAMLLPPPHVARRTPNLPVSTTHDLRSMRPPRLASPRRPNVVG